MANLGLLPIVNDELEEEEDINDEQLNHFFDRDNEEGDPGWERQRSPMPSSNREAAELQASELATLATAMTGKSAYTPRYSNDQKDIPQHFCVPAQGDPGMWSVCVKPDLESSLVWQIAQAIMGNPPAGIASIFSCPGISGYIFVKGLLPDVMHAIQHLGTRMQPKLVPPEDRVTLLSPWILQPHRIHEGEWVHCFVCGHDPTRDEGMIVALVPCIPEQTNRPQKRKRVLQPGARVWTMRQLEAVWGTSWVFDQGNSKYKFCHKTYCSGLILKCLAPMNLKKMSSSPPNIGPFIGALYICDLPSFSPWVHQSAQDTLQPSPGHHCFPPLLLPGCAYPKSQAYHSYTTTWKSSSSLMELINQLDQEPTTNDERVAIKERVASLKVILAKKKIIAFSNISQEHLNTLNIVSEPSMLILKPDHEEKMITMRSLEEDKLWSSLMLHEHLEVLDALISPKAIKHNAVLCFVLMLCQNETSGKVLVINMDTSFHQQWYNTQHLWPYLAPLTPPLSFLFLDSHWG
ncbi:hypothetical protein EDB84DRAFT_1445611 [Lactarius hengduanensis]|nr:hypothetical protein EDB84DRAFT_1445611 [Lactarius hengduanensis]